MQPTQTSGRVRDVDVDGIVWLASALSAALCLPQSSFVGMLMVSSALHKMKCCILLLASIVGLTKAKPNFGHIDLHHPRQVHVDTRRRRLSSVSDLPNYFHHPSRIGVGADLGRRLSDVPSCVRECDDMGALVLGLSTSGFCCEK